MKLDTWNAFWLIKVDEVSSKLPTFNSPCVRLRYLRIPYRIHSASEVCQARIAAIIEPVEGYRNAQDDIIICPDTPEIRTIEVLQTVGQSGLKLNQPVKCQFNLTELIFLEHTISKGIASDARKIKAITDMSEPTNKNYNAF